MLSSLALPPWMMDALIKRGFETQADVLDLGPLQLAKGARAGRHLSVLLAERGGTALQSLTSSPHRRWRSSRRSSTPTTTQVVHVRPQPCVTVCAAARMEGQTALALLQRKRSQRPILTLNQDLDGLLGGGVARGEVTEFCECRLEPAVPAADAARAQAACRAWARHS